MVVPYSTYPTINQLIAGMALDATAASSTAVTATTPEDVSRHTPQQNFLRLLQDAERRHRATLQRAIQAEEQVQQLRQVFQQWQQQLQLQLQAEQQMQRQLLLDQEMQQRQVQRQMQSLYDALLRQQRQQQASRKEIDDMATFQQLHAYTQQQHLGEMQLQMLSLDRGQRAERRSRQALQRQVSQSKRLRESPCCTPPAGGLPPGLPATRDVCIQDDCCPCEFPESCPYNPCSPEDCCDTEIPDGPTTSTDCFLREIRLGLVQPPCMECGSQCWEPRERKRRTSRDSESESGYDADDEASLFSAACSKNSSAFVEERRQILQEVRSLENTRLTPRYKEIYKPLRCFHCGKLDHLATLCPHLPITVL